MSKKSNDFKAGSAHNSILSDAIRAGPAGGRRVPRRRLDAGRLGRPCQEPGGEETGDALEDSGRGDGARSGRTWEVAGKEPQGGSGSLLRAGAGSGVV